MGLSTQDHAESILQDSSADLVALGRELLRNPYRPLQAARVLNDETECPKAYKRARKK